MDELRKRLKMVDCPNSVKLAALEAHDGLFDENKKLKSDCQSLQMFSTNTIDKKTDVPATFVTRGRSGDDGGRRST